MYGGRFSWAVAGFAGTVAIVALIPVEFALTVIPALEAFVPIIPVFALLIVIPVVALLLSAPRPAPGAFIIVNPPVVSGVPPCLCPGSVIAWACPGSVIKCVCPPSVSVCKCPGSEIVIPCVCWGISVAVRMCASSPPLSFGLYFFNGGNGVDVCAPQAPTTKRPRRSGIWKNVLFGANVYVSPITEYNAA